MYRVADFALSNCLNSRQLNILALTQYKSLSLERHLGQGWSRFIHPEFGPRLTIAAPQQPVGDEWYLGPRDGTSPTVRSNTTGGVGGLFGKAFHFFQFHRDEFLAKYRQRSNVESTFSGVKRLMGDSVRSKTDTAMKNEVHCKLIAWHLTCLVHAIYAMGVVPVFWQDGERDEPRAVIRFPTRA
jgi:hypothetical protein